MVEKNPGTQSVVATFRLPPTHHAEVAHVVGDFNDWSETANPMVREEDGFVAHVSLEPGRSYRFRYLLDGLRWENDWNADSYVPNPYGGDDSVIDLTDAALQEPTADTAAPKKARTRKATAKKEARTD